MPDVDPHLVTLSDASLHVIVSPIVNPIVEWRVSSVQNVPAKSDDKVRFNSTAV